MMTDHQLEQSLKAWGQRNRARIAPIVRDAKERNYAVVMQRIQALSVQQPLPINTWSVFSLLNSIVSVSRVPLGVLASFVLVVGLSGSTIMTAAQSLPGSTLYPMKLQLEQAQIDLMPQGAARVQKKIAFAERRLSEFSQLQSQGATLNGSSNAQRVIIRYREQVAQLTVELAQLRGKEDPRRIVDIAMRLDDVSWSGVQAVAQATGHTDNNEVSKTRQVARDASVEAVGIIAANYDQAGISMKDVSSRIETKINATKALVALATDANNKNSRPTQEIFSQAQQQLVKAEQHLARADFGNAMLTLTAGEGLVDQADTQKDDVVSAPQQSAITPVTTPVITTPTLQSDMVQSDVMFSPSKPAYYFNEGASKDAQR